MTRGLFDPRNDPHPDEVDELFFEVNGVSDNPINEREISVVHMIDPNEPSLSEVRFCKNIIKGLSKVESYRKAFEVDKDKASDKAVHGAVDRLLKRPRVARKMYEMREMLMEFEDQDLMTIIQELNADRKLARDLGQPSAATAATKLKAQLLGIGDSKTHTNNITINMSDDQKKSILSRIGHRVLDAANPAIEDAEYSDITERDDD